jgi:hypothetical protein
MLTRHRLRKELPLNGHKLLRKHALDTQPNKSYSTIHQSSPHYMTRSQLYEKARLVNFGGDFSQHKKLMDRVNKILKSYKANHYKKEM